MHGNPWESRMVIGHRVVSNFQKIDFLNFVVTKPAKFQTGNPWKPKQSKLDSRLRSPNVGFEKENNEEILYVEVKH